MTQRIDFEAGAQEAGKRADVVLAGVLPDLSRSAAHYLLAEGLVTVNGTRIKPSRKVGTGDKFSGEALLPPAISAEPQDIPLDVVYQDTDLVVLNKPPGLVVHPAAGHESGTVANALAAMFPQIRGVGNEARPGIVHRLDKDTSGLMVAALTPAALVSLQKQIASREAGRTYIALASGQVQPAEATIEAPIGRDATNRQRMSVHGAAARTARTSYRVVETLPGFSLLRVTLDTGRTHQIRVHLAAMGHPLAGDRVYGGPPLPDLQRQFLHATRLTLRSPSSGEMLEFEAPLPGDLGEILNNLRSSGQ